MKIHNVVQGSPEWLELRAKHFNASEAPAMMGASRYMTRGQLLAQKATGLVPEVDEFTQRLFDKGHAAEEAARPLAEKIIGEDLFPIVASCRVESLPLLASVDGATMLGDTLFEHKLPNQELVECVQAKDLEPHYYWQLEQQLLVTGAERVIFATSDGTIESLHWMEYRAVPGRREQLIAGWKQFEADLENYEHTEAVVEPVGQAPMELPALIVELTGEVKSSNLVTYRHAVLARIEGINTDLKTDSDFANAEQTVKFLADAEKRVDLVKQQALAQTASIDELFRTVDELRETMRAKRLELDKLVKARKDTIRAEIRQDAADAFRKHIDTINTRLGKVRLPDIHADFAGAMKNKRTITSLRDAVDTELARVKISANEWAEKISINLDLIDTLGGKHPMLFADVQDLAMKDSSDLKELVQARIIQHEAAEAKRLEAKQAESQAPIHQATPLHAPHAPVANAAESHPVTPRLSENLSGGISKPAKDRPTGRPTDRDIIDVLTTHFRVHDSQVIEWLLDMDLHAASTDLVSNF